MPILFLAAEQENQAEWNGENRGPASSQECAEAWGLVHRDRLGPGQPEQISKPTPGGAAESAERSGVQQPLSFLHRRDADLCGEPSGEEERLQGKGVDNCQHFQEQLRPHSCSPRGQTRVGGGFFPSSIQSPEMRVEDPQHLHRQHSPGKEKVSTLSWNSSADWC